MMMTPPYYNSHDLATRLVINGAVMSLNSCIGWPTLKIDVSIIIIL